MYRGKLQKARKALGMSQKSVAKILGITQTQYSKKECGLSSFKDSEINILIKLFDKSYEELFKEEENEVL